MNVFPVVKQRFQEQENEKLCNFTVTSDMVKRKLLKLKMTVHKTGSLLMWLERKMLLELVEEISETVGTLFTKFLKCGDVPQNRKMANVTAVYKKVKKSSPSNYRL